MVIFKNWQSDIHNNSRVSDTNNEIFIIKHNRIFFAKAIFINGRKKSIPIMKVQSVYGLFY